MKNKSPWVKTRINFYKDRLEDWIANQKMKGNKFKKMNNLQMPQKSQIDFEKKKELHEDNLEAILLKQNQELMKNEGIDNNQELKVFEKNLQHYKTFYSSNYFPAIKLDQLTKEMAKNDGKK